MISPFILSVAQCNAVFHYSPVCFAVLGSDIMPLLLHAGTNTRRRGLPFQVHTLYIVCLLDFPSFLVRVVLSGTAVWEMCGPNALCLSSSCCISVSQPARWQMMANALTSSIWISPQSVQNHIEHSTSESCSFCLSPSQFQSHLWGIRAEMLTFQKILMLGDVILKDGELEFVLLF